MAKGAIFFGWGETVRGREKQAFQVFQEVLQYYGQLQQQGTIDSFEPFALEPHGGDLLGFMIVKGDRDKLDRLRHEDQFQRLNERGGLVVEHFGVVRAVTGDELMQSLQRFQENAADLAG
jgi:hypothetical protein